MKAISLWQPWASLIIDGRKVYETRHWSTQHRGPLAIHAAKRIDKDACQLFGYSPDAIPCGAVLGIVELEDCLLMSNALIDRQSAVELAVGCWFPGRWAWKMRLKMVLHAPSPAVGRQGLFEWNP